MARPLYRTRCWQLSQAHRTLTFSLISFWVSHPPGRRGNRAVLALAWPYLKPSAVGRAAAERAVLEVKLEALKQKHVDAEEAELSKRQEKLRKQKEMLTLKYELEAANAKLNILSKTKSHGSIGDGMNEYLEKTLKTKELIGKEYEPKLKNVHTKGIQDASVRLKAHAPQPAQLQALKEPHFLGTVRSPIWPDQSKYMSYAQPMHSHPQPLKKTSYEPLQPCVPSNQTRPSQTAEQTQGPPLRPLSGRCHTSDAPTAPPEPPIGNPQDTAHLYSIQ